MVTKKCNQLIQLKPVYGTSKDLVREREEGKCNNILKRYKND